MCMVCAAAVGGRLWLPSWHTCMIMTKWLLNYTDWLIQAVICQQWQIAGKWNTSHNSQYWFSVGLKGSCHCGSVWCECRIYGDGEDCIFLIKYLIHSICFPQFIHFYDGFTCQLPAKWQWMKTGRRLPLVKVTAKFILSRSRGVVAVLNIFQEFTAALGMVVCTLHTESDQHECAGA